MRARRWSQTADLAVTVAAVRTVGAVSQGLGGRLASRLWFTPWPTGATAASQARETAWRAGTDAITVATSGGRLHGFAAGDGPTVLLVHGWGDHAGRMGAFVAPLVSAGYRVVAIDLPGHGANPPATPDIPTLAAAVRQVADELGGVEAVIAHSLGATSTALAIREGLAATRVVLLAPAVRMSHAVDRFASLVRMPPRAVTGLRARLERRFGATMWDEYAVDGWAPQLGVPVLIVRDDADPQVPAEDIHALAAAWPDASLLTTSGLGHHRLLRDEGVIDAAVAFLAGVSVVVAADDTAQAAVLEDA